MIMTHALSIVSMLADSTAMNSSLTLWGIIMVVLFIFLCFAVFARFWATGNPWGDRAAWALATVLIGMLIWNYLSHGR
jgi:RsiW-degrading membrane proteinase PrsW (M82 family)